MGPRPKDGPVLGYRGERIKAGERAADSTREVIDNRNRVILGK